MKSFRIFVLVALIASLSVPAFAQAAPKAAGSNLTIGLVMVGPYNDHGWSQANYDGMQYVVAKAPGTKLVYIDKANSADRPGTTVSQLAESLVAQGAKLICFSSDDMMDEANKFAAAHPDIFVIMASGDQQWKEG
ncbi:BMP family ABC transporter substrate-binding protein, partial [bacterium]|nr:BMP family ABC transporter substrate-binding protein [bacterium]